LNAHFQVGQEATSARIRSAFPVRHQAPCLLAGTAPTWSR
jgi:hypothetical protein